MFFVVVRRGMFDIKLTGSLEKRRSRGEPVERSKTLPKKSLERGAFLLGRSVTMLLKLSEESQTM
jgi:hypothetical protein